MAGIGWAVDRMKQGVRVRRAGWNGKGMWVVAQAGYPEGIAINANTSRATGLPEGSVQRFEPYAIMHNAQGRFVPWLCSQGDLLANDWECAI